MDIDSMIDTLRTGSQLPLLAEDHQLNETVLTMTNNTLSHLSTLQRPSVDIYQSQKEALVDPWTRYQVQETDEHYYQRHEEGEVKNIEDVAENLTENDFYSMIEEEFFCPLAQTEYVEDEKPQQQQLEWIDGYVETQLEEDIMIDEPMHPFN